MTKTEQAAVVRLVRYLQSLQKQITQETTDDATSKEVLTLFMLLWQWTPVPNQPVPSKHKIESLVGLLRGCKPREYCYISAQELAHIIREASKNYPFDSMSIYVSKDSDGMTDTEFYNQGRWNYKETPIVQLLYDIHCNPHLYGSDGERI